MKKIAIIGAGISGISLANVLQERFDVTLFEKHPHVGGLVHCDRLDGVLYHRVGGHVFNSKNQEVLNWFWSKFNKDVEFIEAKRNAKIFYQQKFIGYPIENYLYQLDAKLVELIMDELIHINQLGSKDPMSFANFEAFLLGTFGDTLYELYFKPYNQKIWKVDLSTVAMEWLEGKLPMPRLLEIVTSNISRKEEGQMVHSSFFYPKLGGSQFIVDRLSEGLQVKCNVALDKIEQIDDKLIVHGEAFDDVIYTGDIRKLPNIFKGADGIGASFEIKLNGLRSNGTSSVLCECDTNNLSWLYIPESKFKAHRIIYTGNFSSTNNNASSSRTSCTVEFSGICTYEEMKEELKALPGNLVPISWNNEPNSYIIQDADTRQLIADYKKYLATFGIHVLGRFAEWEYYNMDKAIEAAFLLKEMLVAKHNS
jgi:protoporphyrinogen oxidase